MNIHQKTTLELNGLEVRHLRILLKNFLDSNVTKQEEILVPVKVFAEDLNEALEDITK